MPDKQVKKESPEVVTLKNGIRVVAATLKERKSVAVGIWVAVGARHETQKLAGVSHYLEHLVFKGTHKRTANQIKESVEGVGGSLNAFTSEECTCFLVKSASRHFENVFDVLSDMVLSASLKEADIEKERTVILEEIKMTQDQPSQLADENLSELLWPEHVLGRPIAGTLKTVKGLTPDEIRNYRDRYYRPGLITVVAAGDIASKKLVSAVESRFGRTQALQEPQTAVFKGVQSKPKVKIFNKKTEQVHLALGLHSLPKEHPDQYALDLLNVVLGGNMSSRLFNEVREERGLAYDIGSYQRHFNETGAFMVSAGVDSKKLPEALKVILAELEKVREHLVKPDELKRAKEFYLGQLELGLENSMSQMLWIGESVLATGKPKALKEITRRVEATRLEDLKNIARRLFVRGSLNLSVVGEIPVSRQEDFLKVLSCFPHSA